MPALRHRHIVALLSIAIAAACAREDGGRSATADSVLVDSAAACDSVADRVTCRRRMESAHLAASGGVARRVDDTLLITMADSQPATYVDSVDANDVGVRYTYHGAHPRLGWHLVHVQEYEGDGWLLVHPRTRAEFPLDARPVYAPGMRRFATASWDLEAGYNANALRILSLDADSVWVEWEVEPDDWGPSSPSWSTNNVLRFTKHVLIDGAQYADSAAVVTFTGEGWQIGQP